jgi:uncharacterized protein YbgA (DUF1722 family)
MDLYIHSPIHLHGVVLDLLSTGTTLNALFEFICRFKRVLTMVYSAQNYRAFGLFSWSGIPDDGKIPKAQ